MSSGMTGVDFEDIQGLVRYGYKHLAQACFVLLRIRDAKAARAWLAHAPVTPAVERQPPPRTALQIAISAPGLHRLGVARDIVEGFSAEFLAGMSSDGSRARRLGDLGANGPMGWRWGGAPHDVPHVLLMLYAMPGQLDAWLAATRADCESGFEEMACLFTARLRDTEPFGFVDGISQPRVDWERKRPARDEEQFAFTNRSSLGEYLLGYPNEYGAYTDRPLLAPQRDPGAMLPRAEDAPDLADIGRNGSYLVMRQLRQDVGGFWQFLDREAGGDPALRRRLAEAMVGRKMDGGEALVGSGREHIDGIDHDAQRRNGFTYRSDPDGLRCPLGAHIRRANPRNADLPPGWANPLSRLWRRLGFGADPLRPDLVASARFHRLLRRGREYGGAPGEEAGLHFICLGANIARQFEFVQNAWMAGTRFDGLSGESDPLLGHRLPDVDGSPTDSFSMPVGTGPDRRLSGLPQFVTVMGGAYFFMPGIRALRYLSEARSS
ncbi:Dyp-type peroxidase family protein [Variovorax sp. PBS-H4]|nr:Dyp-type peroxidase family protein [Variovorax sp. PBS-H4]